MQTFKNRTAKIQIFPDPEPVATPWTITTAIPYVNAKPHIGFALEMIQADVLARFRRSQGHDVRFQGGTDENSLKNVLAAEKAGFATSAYIAGNASAFIGLKKDLNLSVDDYIRTSTDPRHRPGVERLWRACARTGDLYRKQYEGLYCVGCEQFYKPTDLDNGLCPEHKSAPEHVCETNYFFRLSRYRQKLLDLFVSGKIEILPAHRKNEVLRWIETGLEDFSVSRSSRRARGWGIPVPDDPEQVIYVWFDALANYITSLNYSDDGTRFDRYWRGARAREHVIGKGVTRFHAIYWPAMLLSAGLSLPTRLYVHGYVTAEGQKISKSLGNSVDPTPIAKRFGSDALRYFLLRHIRTGEDGDYSQSRFEQAYQSELAGQLGNLAHRVDVMIDRYEIDLSSGEAARSSGDWNIDQEALDSSVAALSQRVGDCIEKFALHEGLAAIWETIALANRSISSSAPWSLEKRFQAAGNAAEAEAARADLERSLIGPVCALRRVAGALAPFMPITSARLFKTFASATETKEILSAGNLGKDGRAVLFPKPDRLAGPFQEP